MRVLLLGVLLGTVTPARAIETDTFVPAETDTEDGGGGSGGNGGGGDEDEDDDTAEYVPGGIRPSEVLGESFGCQACDGSGGRGAWVGGLAVVAAIAGRRRR